MPISDEQTNFLFQTIGEIKTDIKYLVEHFKASDIVDQRFDRRVRRLELLAAKMLMFVTAFGSLITVVGNWLGKKTGMISQ